MPRRDVLVITTDPLTARMPGPAIRAWHLAEVLARRHAVVLASAVACDRHHSSMEVCFAGADAMEALAATADVIVGPGSVVRRYPAIAAGATPLVVDLYDPYHLENLEPDGTGTAAAHADNLRHLNAVVNDDLARGDFFLCASARQRDFWLGSLTAVGRVNPATYADDPRLQRLIATVPFGLSPTAPSRHGPGLRERIPGIGPDDPVLVWGGGVYNWFDPASLIRAVALAVETIPDLRLVFLGMRNPNDNIPEMTVAGQARALAVELGVAGTHVFFNEGWVPYEQRADFLLDADMGVSTHLDHIETRFAFRTRVLDYLWAGLPMVLTEGDSLAELVETSGAGVTVPAGDVAAIAAAIGRVLVHRPAPGLIAGLAGTFHWDHVARPLLDYCEDPWRAPDAAPVSGAPAEATVAAVGPVAGMGRRRTVRILRGARRRIAARLRRT